MSSKMVPTFFPLDRYRWLLLLIDFLIVVATIQSAQHILLASTGAHFLCSIVACIVTMLLHLIMIYIFDLYNVRHSFLNRITGIKCALAVGAAAFFSSFFFYAIPQWQLTLEMVLTQILTTWALLFGWRCCFTIFFMKREVKRPILVIGAGNSGMLFDRLVQTSDTPYQIVGFLDDNEHVSSKSHVNILGKTNQLLAIATQQNISMAVLAITHNRPQALIKNILEARFQGMQIVEMPALYENLTGSVPVSHLRYDWLLFADGFDLLSKPFIRRAKRLIDFSVSILLLIVSFPLMLLTVLLIRIDSPGPIFFKQYRVGQGGKVFNIWKFRSMREDAEKKGAQWAEKNDPRVTRVGKVIRLLRIDELPQIFNVFRGEMSLIGPRPERPEFVRELEVHIPFYNLRHYVHPGITGWAQVKHHYTDSIQDSLEKLSFDVYYIKNMSLLLDFRIILKTIGVICFGKGAR